MALVRIPERQQTIDDKEAVTSFLATYGITYERWESKRHVSRRRDRRGGAAGVRATRSTS